MQTESRRSLFDRRSAFALSIVAPIILFVSSSRTPIGIAPIDKGFASCAMIIEFLEPRDWRCMNHDRERCVECLNVSDHSSELAFRCVDQTTTELRKVPPGAEISICRGEKAPTPSSL